MPWYSVTISAPDILAGQDSAFERAFTDALMESERQSAASLWWSHKLEDGSITYFISATANEVSIKSIAAFSPSECKEPDFSVVKLLHHAGSPLTLEGGNKP